MHRMTEAFRFFHALDGLAERDLDGLLSHWDFKPPPGTLLRMLKGSSLVILARDAVSSRVAGYITALTDHVSCGYISGLEVRPDHRQRGLGTELLRQMTERLDVPGIYLSCAPALVPFYEAAGFRRITGMSRRRLPTTASA
jgi:ribosomal protein S18 acetylase RimI-like enzyme